MRWGAEMYKRTIGKGEDVADMMRKNSKILRRGGVAVGGAATVGGGIAVAKNKKDKKAKKEMMKSSVENMILELSFGQAAKKAGTSVKKWWGGGLSKKQQAISDDLRKGTTTTKKVQKMAKKDPEGYKALNKNDKKIDMMDEATKKGNRKVRRGLTGGGALAVTGGGYLAFKPGKKAEKMESRFSTVTRGIRKGLEKSKQWATGAQSKKQINKLYDKAGIKKGKGAISDKTREAIGLPKAERIVYDQKTWWNCCCWWNCCYWLCYYSTKR